MRPEKPDAHDCAAMVEAFHYYANDSFLTLEDTVRLAAMVKEALEEEYCRAVNDAYDRAAKNGLC